MDPLASELAMRGTWNILSGAHVQGAFVGTAVSFPFRLAAPPTAHFIPVGAAAPAGCSGNVQAPEAARGHLCAFEFFRNNVDQPVVCNLHLPYLDAVRVRYAGTHTSGKNIASSRGTWAVTAGTGQSLAGQSSTPS
jgi:hypothetical protein